MKLNRFLYLLVAVLLTAPVQAQQQRRNPYQQDLPPAPPSPVNADTSGALLDSNRDYVIGAGDIIEIKIEDAPELSRHYQLTAAGTIEMPVIGLVAAQNKTREQLARLIAESLRQQDYLKAPNVIVSITKFNTQTFFIQGAVHKPGVYQIEGRPSVLTMVGLAGGLTDNHGSTVFILRPTRVAKPAVDTVQRTPVSQAAPAPPANADEERTASNEDASPTNDYELIKINLSALYKGHFDQNQRLEPGDIINIPRADTFYVAGEVQAPGSFPLKEGTTLRQAISLAQGMTFKAKATQGVIFREDPVSGSRQEIKIDIGAVMSGKKEDLPIRANDVIIIPNSRTKSVGGALLMAFGINNSRIPVRGF